MALKYRPVTFVTEKSLATPVRPRLRLSRLNGGTTMAIDDLGTVRASVVRALKGPWDSRTGKVQIKDEFGPFSGRAMRRIGMHTRNKAGATSYASEWVESRKAVQILLQ